MERDGDARDGDPGEMLPGISPGLGWPGHSQVSASLSRGLWTPRALSGSGSVSEHFVIYHYYHYYFYHHYFYHFYHNLYHHHYYDHYNYCYHHHYNYCYYYHYHHHEKFGVEEPWRI